jgi:hypothetical protein
MDICEYSINFYHSHSRKISSQFFGKLFSLMAELEGSCECQEREGEGARPKVNQM